MKEVIAFDGTVFELNEQGDPAPNGYREYNNFNNLIRGDKELKSLIDSQARDLQTHKVDFDDHEANLRTPQHITEQERSSLIKVIKDLADLSEEVQNRITCDKNLQIQINSLNNLGRYIGAFQTVADLPQNTSALPAMSVSANDFATVRVDTNGNSSRYVIINVNPSGGDITWADKPDVVYSTDILGKLNKPANDGFVVCNEDGTTSAVGGANADGSGLIASGIGKQEIDNDRAVVLTTIQSTDVDGSAIINTPMYKELTGKGGIEVTSEKGNIIIDGSKVGGSATPSTIIGSKTISLNRDSGGAVSGQTAVLGISAITALQGIGTGEVPFAIYLPEGRYRFVVEGICRWQLTTGAENLNFMLWMKKDTPNYVNSAPHFSDLQTVLHPTLGKRILTNMQKSVSNDTTGSYAKFAGNTVSDVFTSTGQWFYFLGTMSTSSGFSGTCIALAITGEIEFLGL